MSALKSIPSCFWPRVITAVSVLVCVTIFNLQPNQYLYLGNAESTYTYGWPWSDRAIERDVFSFKADIATVKMDYVAVVGNILVGLALIALAILGNRQLQRINGKLWQIHLMSAFLLMLCVGILLWLNMEEKIQWTSMRKGFRYFGWPYMAAARLSPDFDPTLVEPAVKIVWKGVARNIFAALYGCFVVWVISESWLAWRARKTKS